MIEPFEAPSGTLQVRETHDYVGTYAHLDRWSEVGTYTVLSSRPVAGEGEADGSLMPGYAVSLLVEPGRGATARQIRAGIEDTFTVRGCACEHDCCGCVSHGVSEVRRTRGHIWAFAVQRSRNV